MFLVAVKLSSAGQSQHILSQQTYHERRTAQVQCPLGWSLFTSNNNYWIPLSGPVIGHFLWELRSPLGTHWFHPFIHLYFANIKALFKVIMYGEMYFCHPETAVSRVFCFHFPTSGALPIISSRTPTFRLHDAYTQTTAGGSRNPKWRTGIVFHLLTILANSFSSCHFSLNQQKHQR